MTVKQISIFVLGFATAFAFACAPAPAQDLTVGKTPAQLFRSDCAGCHRSPGSVARTRDVHALADFLREHYTTKSETAGALAAYVSSFAPGGATARNRSTGGAARATAGHPEAGRRNRGEGEVAANGGDARSKARPVEDPAGRHRRTTSLSGDGEKRREGYDGEVPRPPDGIPATPVSSQSNARPRGGERRDAVDPISRLRSDLPSRRSSENPIAEAGRTGAPKARKRHHRVNAGPSAPDAQAETKTNAAEPPSRTIGSTVPVTSQRGNVSPASAPTVAPAVTSP